MAEYRVACYHVSHGYVYVEAKDEDEAIRKATTELENEGGDALSKIFDREFSAVEAEPT